MLAAAMSETVSTLSVLSETLEVIDWFDGLIFRKNLNSQLDHDSIDQKSCFVVDKSETARKKYDDSYMAPNIPASVTLHSQHELDTVISNIGASFPILKEDDHISRDRLVEVIEGKLEQLEFAMTTRVSTTPDVPETEVSQVVETEVSQVAETKVSQVAETEVSQIAETEVSQITKNDVSQVAETEVSQVAETEVSQAAETEVSQISETGKAAVAYVVEAEVMTCDDIVSSFSSKENVTFQDNFTSPNTNQEEINLIDIVADLSLDDTDPKAYQLEYYAEKVSQTDTESPRPPSVQESQCASLLDTTFSGSEISVNTLTSEDVFEDDEPHRPKKKLTVSWDPAPLLQHLYHIPEVICSETSTEPSKSVECYLDFEPVGIFEDWLNPVYVVLDGSCLRCYESQTKKTILQEVHLQYASMEVTDKTSLLIDNRLGKWMKLKFETEDDLQVWKELFQSHCKLHQGEKYLEPIHFPLKFYKNIIIIDLGSCSTRAGILMDQPTLPKLFFPTVCATDKKTCKQTFGIEALLPGVRKKSTLSFPARPSAKVTKFTMDIDALSGLFKMIFSNLKVDPKYYTIQLCIPRSLSTNTQIALVKLLLEEIGVEAVSLTRQALLTLYAHNTSTAIVVDIGDRMEVLPVADGFILEGGVSRLPYGGQRIIHHLKHALAQKHISLSNDIESFVVQYIFENLCYISRNYDEEMSTAVARPNLIRKTIPLSPFFEDSNKLKSVTLDIGRFQVPEGLFKPELWGLDSPGLHQLVHQAIQTSGLDVRRQMAENIFLSGGITLLPGFVERLQDEMAKLTLPRLMPKVHASPYRYHTTYLGACRLASSDAFSQVCITAKEWMISGSSALSRWHL